MASLGLVFDILARDNASTTFKKVGTEAERAGSKIDNAVGAGLKKSLAIGAGALAGISIVGFFKDTIGAASAAEQSVGGVQAVFKDYSKSVITDSKNADRAVGLSANSYRELATVIGAQLKNASVPMEELGQRTEDIIGIGSDLAAQFGGSTQEAVEALSSAFRGEMDPIEKYGISLNEASLKAKALELGLTDGQGPLDQHAKVMAGLAIVTEQSADAQGAFAREADTAAGRAARAAAQWDNLTVAIGDELLPAWSGLMDILGTAVIPALGEVVSIASGAVKVFGELPGPLQAGAIAFGAWTLAGGKIATTLSGLKTSGAGQVFDDLRLKMMYAKDEGEGLRGKIGAIGSTAGTVASGALKSLARAIGPELGVAVAVAVISDVAESIHGIATAGDDAREEVDALSDALKGSFGTERVSVATQNIESLRASLEGAREELVRVKDTGTVLQAASNALSALQFASDAKNASESMEVYEKALADAEAQQAALNSTTETLAGRFHLTTDQVLALADKYKIDLSQGVTESTRLLENFYTQEYGRKPTEATIDFTDAIDGARTELQRAKDAVDAYKLSLDILTGENVSAIEVEAAFQDSLAAAKDAVKDLDGSVRTSKGSLNLHSEAGRAASDVLLDIRDSGNQLISTLIDQGASTDEVTRRDQKLRESFIKSARQMGFSQDEARKLADDILGIPAERETQIKADTKAANDAIDAVQRNIDNTTGKTITVQVRAAGRFIVNPNGGLQEFWKGGYTGPGGMFDVKGLVHGDEFVVPKRIVRSMGGPRAVAAAVGMGGDIGAGNPVITLIHDTRSVEDDIESVANAVKKAAPKAGVAGTGSVGGGWQSIWDWVRARIPQARINSTYRPGDPGYHGLGKAIDFGYGSVPGGLGSAGLALINRTLHDGLGANLAELIYDGYGDDRPDLKNGRPLTYSYGTQLEHRNHVHAAVYDQGGILPPGLTMAYNGTGKNEHVVTNGGLAGLEISGRLVLDEDGFARIVDGRIVEAFTATADRSRY